MDDAQGTDIIQEPSRFSVHFGHDGLATLKLDCNRGSSTWHAQANEGLSEPGKLTFGPVTATRAACPPPNTDQRLARDLSFVRSYVLRDGKLFMSLMADGGIYEWHPASPTTRDSERVARTISFPAGKSTLQFKGNVQGRHYIDYQLQAAAGQTLTASLKGKSSSTYVNLLPPGSSDVAMLNGQLADNQLSSLLPTDGLYTLRVYLVRAAARRNAHSDFNLTVGLSGQPLKALPAQTDALVPGTHWHAQTTVKCTPAYAQVQECRAGVVRRGNDGTATVELSWGQAGQLRILFIKGDPKASDISQAMRVSRNERGWLITFSDGGRFEIPEALVFGG